MFNYKVIKNEKTILLYFYSIIISSCTKDPEVDVTDPKISQSQALKLVEEYYLDSDYNVFVSESLITGKTEILCSETVCSPDYYSWLVFIDENPGANWEHPCKLIFINANTGDLNVTEEKFPPNLSNLTLVKQKELSIQITESDYIKISTNNQTKGVISYDSSNCWAIIISGGANKYSNYERYWNDCSAIFSTLKNVYGYKQSNIKVIMSDGTDPAADRIRINGTFDSSPLDLDGDGINNIQYAATKNNVKNVIAQVLNTMDTYEKLFIFVTDHGDLNSNGESVIYLWNNETITATEFANVIKDNNKVDRNCKDVHVVMGQCYSGGFASTFKSMNIGTYSISTACAINEVSFATSNLLYDEYLYQWICAMAGKNIENNNNVNADTNNDGLVTFEEAFIYARNNDRRNETPQYSSYRDVWGTHSGLWVPVYDPPGTSRTEGTERGSGTGRDRESGRESGGESGRGTGTGTGSGTGTSRTNP